MIWFTNFSTLWIVFVRAPKHCRDESYCEHWVEFHMCQCRLKFKRMKFRMPLQNHPRPNLELCKMHVFRCAQPTAGNTLLTRTNTTIRHNTYNPRWTCKLYCTWTRISRIKTHESHAHNSECCGQSKKKNICFHIRSISCRTQSDADCMKEEIKKRNAHYSMLRQ